MLSDGADRADRRLRRTLTAHGDRSPSTSPDARPAKEYPCRDRLDYNDIQLDALRELANIGSGHRRHRARRSMLGREVELTVPACARAAARRRRRRGRRAGRDRSASVVLPIWRRPRRASCCCCSRPRTPRRCAACSASSRAARSATRRSARSATSSAPRTSTRSRSMTGLALSRSRRTSSTTCSARSSRRVLAETVGETDMRARARHRSSHVAGVECCALVPAAADRRRRRRAARPLGVGSRDARTGAVKIVRMGELAASARRLTTSCVTIGPRLVHRRRARRPRETRGRTRARDAAGRLRDHRRARGQVRGPAVPALVAASERLGAPPRAAGGRARRRRADVRRRRRQRASTSARATRSRCAPRWRRRGIPVRAAETGGDRGRTCACTSAR